MKKKTKRVVPALLSLVMAVSSVPGPAYGAPLVTLFSSAEDDTQMVSDAETVFVNFYDGSVRSQDFNSNWKFFPGKCRQCTGGQFRRLQVEGSESAP